MSVGTGAAKGAAAGSVAGIPGAVVGAGIGAVTSLLGAHKQSKSADKAATLQSQAADASLAEQKRVFDIQDQRYKESQARAQTFRDAPMTYQPYQPLPSRYLPPQLSQGRPQAAMGQPQPAYGPQGLQAPQGAPQTDGTPQQSMVTMKAPNGQIGHVPADQVDRLIARGAVRVN